MVHVHRQQNCITAKGMQKKKELHPDDWLFAFLDDLYVVSTRERAGEAFQRVARSVEERAGVCPD